MFFLSFRPFVLFDPPQPPPSIQSPADPTTPSPISDRPRYLSPDSHYLHHVEETDETCKQLIAHAKEMMTNRLVPKVAKEKKPRVKDGAKALATFEQQEIPSTRQ
jgi:hypothetical protein